MIKMKQPSLVLHAKGIEKNGYLYKMWATWTVPSTLTPTVLVGWIEHAIDVSEELYLHNVIINCHGEPGYIHIGTGIGENDLDPFTRLRQKQSIGRIWLVACRVHATGTSAWKQLLLVAGRDGGRARGSRRQASGQHLGHDPLRPHR